MSCITHLRSRWDYMKNLIKHWKNGERYPAPHAELVRNLIIYSWSTKKILEWISLAGKSQKIGRSARMMIAAICTISHNHRHFCSNYTQTLMHHMLNNGIQDIEIYKNSEEIKITFRDVNFILCVWSLQRKCCTMLWLLQWHLLSWEPSEKHLNA